MSGADIEKDASAMESTTPTLASNNGRESPAAAVDEKAGAEVTPQQPRVPSNMMDFPEGGFRAWSVVFGTSAVLFCSFGYANAFG